MIIVLDIIKYLFGFWLIMTGIYLGIETIIFFSSLIYDEHSIKWYYERIDNWVTDYISKIGYAILIVGKIGSGKTTQQAMLSHFLTIDCYLKVKKVMDDFREEYIELDYTMLNGEIEKLFAQYTKAMEEDPEVQYHFKNLFDVLADKYADLYASHRNDDGVNLKTFYDEFYKYVFAYCRLKNNHYVCCNTKLYSYITHNYAYGFESRMMNLKEMYEEESLYFDEYMVICKDENSADPNDYYLNYKEIYQEDNGKHLFLRFIRHIFEGTVRFLTTDQDATGMVANQRKIMDTFIYVMGNQIVCDRPTLTKLIVRLKGFVKVLEKEYARLFVSKEKRSVYVENPNRFKKVIRFLKRMQAKVYSKSLIVYTNRIYKDADDCSALRNNTEGKSYYKDAKLIGPIQWAFGSIDTHEFHYIYRWFQSKYGHNFWNLHEFKDICTQVELDKKAKELMRREKKKGKKSIVDDLAEVDEEYIVDNG